MKNTMNVIKKNTLDGINIRLQEAEEQISNLEDTVVESNQDDQMRGKKQNKTVQIENSLREFNDSTKCKKKILLQKSQKKKRKKGKENVCEETIAENFLNWEENRYPDPGGKEIPLQNQTKEVHIKIPTN